MPRRSRRKLPRKYDIDAPAIPILSAADGHVLAKLVEKYGADSVAAAIPNAQRRKRGRPSRGLLPHFEKMSDADWIDARAAEYQAENLSAPIRQARIDYFHYKRGHFLPLPSASELATVKKIHLAGRALRKQRADAKGEK